MSPGTELFDLVELYLQKWSSHGRLLSCNNDVRDWMVTFGSSGMELFGAVDLHMGQIVFSSKWSYTR